MVSLGNGISLFSSCKQAGTVLVTIRPEAISVHDAPVEASDNTFTGRIVKIYNGVIFTKIDIDIGISITAYAPNHWFEGNERKINDRIYLNIPPGSVNLINNTRE